MPNISLMQREIDDIPKSGYYFTKFKNKFEEEVCFCTKYGVYVIGSENIYSFEIFEYFKDLNSYELSLWLDAVKECAGIPEYRIGAIAVSDFVERLRKHERKT